MQNGGHGEAAAVALRDETLTGGSGRSPDLQYSLLISRPCRAHARTRVTETALDV